MVGTPARVNAPSAHCGHAMMLSCPTLPDTPALVDTRTSRTAELLHAVYCGLQAPHLRWMECNQELKSEQTLKVAAVRSCCAQHVPHFDQPQMRCAAENCQSTAPLDVSSPQNVKIHLISVRTKRRELRSETAANSCQNGQKKKKARLERRFLPISEAFFHPRGSNLGTEWYPKQEDGQRGDK